MKLWKLKYYKYENFIIKKVYNFQIRKTYFVCDFDIRSIMWNISLSITYM